MVSFSEAVQESGRLALCALFAANESANALVSPLLGDSLGLYPLTSGLRRQLCSDDPDNDPVYVPEFTGGQCPIRYRVFAQQWSNSQGTYLAETQITSNIIGPVAVVANPEVQPPPGGCPAGSFFNNSFLRDGTGQIANGLASGCLTNALGYIGLRVEPFDAVPDNCGDPPPVIGPPGDVFYEAPDITYNIDESTDITVPISFTFSPAYVDLDGSINVPVTFDVGGLDFNGELTVAPEFNFEFKPGGISTGPGTVDDPEGIGEPGEPSDPVDDPDGDDRPIIGVLVYSSLDPDSNVSSIQFVSGPNIYVPRVASVKFAIKTADSIGWTSDIDVKNLECYVPCPAPQGAIAVRVQPMPGVTRSFTPVRGRVLTP